jgi:hypothetical protein
MMIDCDSVARKGKYPYRVFRDGFGGLVVSMLASGTQGRGFKPGLPPEGK